MKSKIIYKILFWVMIYCVFSDTVGIFIPVYFTDPSFNNYFYPFIFILICITVAIWSYRTMYIPQEDNWKYSTLISFITTLLAVIIFGIVTLFKIWPVEGYDTILYVKKDSPKVQIVSHYFNLGAIGDGARIVVRRELTSFLKFERLIDTNSINRHEWKKIIYTHQFIPTKP